MDGKTYSDFRDVKMLFLKACFRVYDVLCMLPKILCPSTFVLGSASPEVSWMGQVGPGTLLPKPSPFHYRYLMWTIDVFLALCKLWVETALEDFANFIT